MGQAALIPMFPRTMNPQGDVNAFLRVIEPRLASLKYPPWRPSGRQDTGPLSYHPRAEPGGQGQQSMGSVDAHKIFFK